MLALILAAVLLLTLMKDPETGSERQETDISRFQPVELSQDEVEAMKVLYLTSYSVMNQDSYDSTGEDAEKRAIDFILIPRHSLYYTYFEGQLQNPSRNLDNPIPSPPVLQADHDRRIRPGLRDWPRLPGATQCLATEYRLELTQRNFIFAGLLLIAIGVVFSV